MNKKYLYILIAIIIGYTEILGLKVNGKELCSFMQQDRSLVFKLDRKRAFRVGGLVCISLIMKDNNIKVCQKSLDRSSEFNKSDIKSLELYESYGEVNILSESDLSVKSSCVSGMGGVILASQNKLEICDTEIKSKKNLILCKSLKAHRCFLDAGVLQIEVSSPQSLCKIIRITFDRLNWDRNIEGHFNFEENKTEGEFLFIGASKIEIMFNSNAFIPEEGFISTTKKSAKNLWNKLYEINA